MTRKIIKWLLNIILGGIFGFLSSFIISGILTKNLASDERILRQFGYFLFSLPITLLIGVFVGNKIFSRLFGEKQTNLINQIVFVLLSGVLLLAIFVFIWTQTNLL
ncbi:MAG: hypothetical protein UU34_C0003G0020 [Candidatus Curtissbacteria bacterium GW2011_GWA1_41_11]|uniref:Uncharacterized protein n=1 Tax=Candidatus Curtissbacteria bacterium GW2011_GWA1_41_11 TaxID=1618409 RepID=A0A0G0UFL6_9BACT|nr:MAG: hypothetical protein UU34_C0003G0020 [Candidatus Curtissbacteria bacterium GW2011_GWA1_41_11]